MTSFRHFEKFCNRDLALEILTQKYFRLTILSLTILNETENDAFSTSSESHIWVAKATQMWDSFKIHQEEKKHLLKLR